MYSHIWKIAKNVGKREKVKTLLMIVTIIGSVIAALLPPLVLGNMIDRLTNQKMILFSIAFTYLLTIAIAAVFESVQNIMITVIGQKITHEMRSVMSLKMSKLPTSYFTEHEVGTTVSRFVNDVDTMDGLFTNGIISMCIDACKVISILLIIFIKSKGLGLIMCIVTPLLFVMTMIFQKRMRKAQMENRRAVARVDHHVPETIENIRMVHTFSCEKFMEEKYDAYIEMGYRSMNQSNFYDSIYSPIVIFVSSMVIAVMMTCTASGASMQQFFGISVGSTVAMIAYVGKVFDPLESLGMEIQNIQAALAGVERIDEFLNEEEIKNEQFENAKDEFDHGIKTRAENFESAIVFEHVTFAYEDGKEILSDLSFEIPKGQYTVLTGRTGVGKSTIFKLLLGLYQPAKGTIWIEGKGPFKIPPEERRKIFGYVPQEFVPIEGTVADQIRMMKEDILDTDIWNVLERCGLKDKMEHISGNINAQMNISDFSQGELQLLSIARALITEPHMMLLDEMTASLDSNTEEKILAIIQEFAEERTILSISHRLAEKTEHQLLHLSE